MKILIVNTSERIGGAAVAAHRLTDALNKHGVKAKMLVRDKQTTGVTTIPLPTSWRRRWHFLWERFVIWWHNGFSRKNLFAVDIANAGTDITRLPEFKEADLIHLHWINQGMLSLDNIRKIVASGKPVVWTMHDMWPCTGICHHARECNGFHGQCGQCFYLRFPKDKDLSYKVLAKKRQAYAGGKIHFVTCSHWLEKLAKQSNLPAGSDVRTIHNALNTSLFQPADRQEARRHLDLPADKRLILFGSVKITDKRKGIDYFVEACHRLVKKAPELDGQLGIVVFGSGASALAELLPLPVYPLGYIQGEQEMTHVYNAVDLYATPSLEENLPNTIAEAMACGTPCVGFNIGGIPEMIDHRINGYVAAYRNAEDFAQGIHWILQEADGESLAIQARKKAINAYSEESVARQYIRLYEEIPHYS